MTSRPETIQDLSTTPLDLLVIGGGIVGSGIVRDAAMRGLRVGLVEQHDFAFGTSSRSSRLLHGGMRYLAQGRLGLVRQASIEKKILHRIAPHLAEPLPFVFPAYTGDRHWRLWQLKIGVKLYDLLCGGRNLGNSAWWNSVRTLQEVPGLKPTRLKGAVKYYDGFTNDARLVLDTLRSAGRRGARLLNYCRFEDAECSQKDRIALRTCKLRDLLRREEFEAKAWTVVNATGPWAHSLPHSAVKLRLTKGVHIVVERDRIPVEEALVMTEDKRILFAIPWGKRTIIGTTDSDYNGPLDDVHATPEDIRYLLDITNRFFPNARLGASDIIGNWAGLRPLIANSDGRPSDISRAHEIRCPEPGWWDVAGGKLTTYRLMAEETVDQIVEWLGESGASGNTRFRPCQTANEPLLPAEDTAGVSGILPPEASRNVVEHYIKNEWAVHLDDVMVRRTSWHYYFREAQQMARQVADWMSELLNWAPETRTAELERYRGIC